MADTGQDIELSDSMTLADLLIIEKDTQGRISIDVDASGLFAVVIVSNYTKTTSGKRIKNLERGSWKLQPKEIRKVLLI